jgi:hypothetical protein
MENFEQLLELSWAFDQNDPAKALTKAKEMAIAKDINDKFGTEYAPSNNCAEAGIDLTSPDGASPVQSKTCQGSMYAFGHKLTVQMVVDKALKVNADALLSLARLEGSKVVEHVIGRIDLLDGYTNSKGKPAHNISFKQLREQGFTDV